MPPRKTTTTRKSTARKPPTPKAEPTSLDKTIDGIKKKWDLRVAPLDELEEVEAISTGNLAIDYITGVWGLPIGRLIELYGLPSSGKSTTALQAAVAAQQLGKTVVYLDYENSLDPDYCQALGVQIDRKFLLAQPETFEQGMNALREMIATGEVGLAIVDSVAAMTTEKELEIETGSQSNFGEKARLMGQAMRQLGPILQRTGTTAVFLNQLRDKINLTGPAAGMQQTITPGGKALKFHASMRIEYKQIGNVKRNRYDALSGEQIQVADETRVIATVTKNKVGPPFRKAEVRMQFGHGLSQAWSAVQVLMAHGHIKKTGSTYTMSGTVIPMPDLPDKIVGEDRLLQAIEANEEWLATLTAMARSILESGGEPPAEAEEQKPALEVVPDPEPEPEAAPVQQAVGDLPDFDSLTE